MNSFLDPRDGDLESDASSSKNRSMLSLAGSLLAEISLPKLVVAWFVLLGLPAFMLGAVPILASVWGNIVVQKFSSLLYGLLPALLLVGLIIAGLFGGRRLFRLAERNFWSLNSLAVQPVYAVCRELLNQIGDRLLPEDVADARRTRWRSATAILSGAIICLLSIAILLLVLPYTRLLVEFSALYSPVTLVKNVLANSIAIVAAYVAVAVMVWSIADATIPPTRAFKRFASAPEGARTWRIAHLSDIHIVGERYGFRIESGRSGPRGNDRFVRALETLRSIHSEHPLDAVLISGDITDAGLSAEWAEFMSAIASFPELAKLTLLIPGNHDINIVSRVNPAQFDLPTSPYKKLRKLRTLSALNAIQGSRVHVIDRKTCRLGGTLEDALTPHLERMMSFANTGRPRLHSELDDLWSNVFPMALPPSHENGLGILLLNSNADAHFSFTNALGLVSADQFAGVAGAMAQYPRAGWIICIHHHPIEYPRAAAALSERIGTTLINGQWFVRRLQGFADRVVVMHGHRHIDWFGECGGFPIISAPSTVMGEEPDAPTHFYIHTVAVAPSARLGLREPQRVVINGQHNAASGATPNDR
ncbi:MAG: metallophosphoesterase [Xanthobacteraceae bacterium]|nr:metallophosphoesterase [Xanthobacteraceae bacterium]